MERWERVGERWKGGEGKGQQELGGGGAGVERGKWERGGGQTESA